MKYNLAACFLFGLSLIGILTGYLLLFHQDYLFFCSGLGTCESDSLLFGVAKPLFWSTYLLPPLFFGLIFVRREVFWAWAKFIPWFAVPGFIIIARTSPIGQSILDSGRTSVTESIVQILVTISVIFIAWKYWRLSKKRS